MVEKEVILQNLSVSDIYGEHLEKSGKGYKMLCPFHEEKTPSFLIYNDLSFYCFGCHVGGSAFDYIMKRENKTFSEALKHLADKAGIDTRTGRSKYANLYNINRETMDLYEKQLWSSTTALGYLLKRGLSEETIRKFHLGYAKDPVVGVLKNNHKEEDMIAAGIAVKKNGALKDFFFNRIMFPITHLGAIRSFGGRVTGKGTPKYLNTINTPIFQKQKMLYGMDPQAIKKKGFAIVVEGYIDVIMCHQYGYNNTVAPLGTALTERQIELLNKYTDQIVTVFDGDLPGNKAVKRAVKLLFDCKMQGSVLLLPENEDPDSYLRRHGSLPFDTSIPYSVFLAKNYPDTRKMLYNSLIRRRRPFEIAEFLSHMGTHEEVKEFMEMSARFFVEAVIRKAPVVLRDKGIEIRRAEDYLVLLSNKRFLFWRKIANKDPKVLANEMLKSTLKLRRIRRKISK